MSEKIALLTGITGQDGSYLAELLLNKGYKVYGIIRRASNFNTHRIDHLYNNHKLHLVYGDLNDASSLNRIVKTIKPDEIYNLGAQSHVKVSFEIPEYTAETTGLGTLRLLEAIRDSGIKTKFYQASSSEMFGTDTSCQDELTPFRPCSPYGIAKLFSYWTTINYREAYNIFVCNGILFNHESPRRGETFVTRKITLGLARIKYGLQKKIYLGNLKAKRDWGFAGDYVEAMWMMLQHNRPDDYVIATGETHSVLEFVEEAFGYAGLRWGEYVDVDKKYFRPTEIDCLEGDSTKARNILKWKPKVNFKQLVRMMVDADIERIKSLTTIKPIHQPTNHNNTSS